jgi:hypothetical protein
MQKKIWLVAGIGATLGVAGLAACVLKQQGQRNAATAAAETPAASAAASAPRNVEPAEAIYDGKIADGWEDWGWGPHQLGGGPAKIVFTGYGGILFHHAELPPDYGGVSFRYKAPAEWGEFMHVSLRWAGAPDDAFPTVMVEPKHVVALEDGWREVLIDWQQLNPDHKPFDRVMIGSRSQVGADPVLLEHVVLTKSSAPKLVVAPERDEPLTVICGGESHPISELIYGAASDTWSSGHTEKRMGGNPLSRLNWELGAWNAGNDWFFENGTNNIPLFQQVNDAAQAQHKLAVVVPMLGWVAKDGSSFGFPRAKFPVQRKFDPYKGDAGDGFRPDGSPIPPGDPSQTSVPAPPELIGKWVSKLVAQDKARGSRGVQMYILDNEPSIWSTTHRDVHPQPLSYDELLERTLKYATAIRDADHDAVIAGPAEWGWTGYQFSGVDREAGTQLAPDRTAHAGLPLVAWYLKQLAAYEKATGKRALDVFDLHFYPAQDKVYSDASDPRTSELRLRSTRGLWDPSYRDESWIADTVRLIPRMKDWVREFYPGLKLSLGEWSFGAENHISGGLATAEALGRFGQQGLDAAFHWGGLKEGTATYWAFRAFRNFDGAGGRFLDVSLPVKEAEKVSLFASRNQAADHLVLVLINKEAKVKIHAKVALQGCGNVASARLFSYDGSSKKLNEAKADAAASGVSATLESYSLTVLDLKLRKP